MVATRFLRSTTLLPRTTTYGAGNLLSQPAKQMRPKRAGAAYTDVGVTTQETTTPTVPQAQGTALFDSQARSVATATNVTVDEEFPAPKISPAESDAQRFALDPSVNTWCNPEAPYGNQVPNDLSGILRSFLTEASQGVEAAGYWTYHMARFGFFASQGVAGLVAHTLTEALSSPSSLDVSKLPLTRIGSRSDKELSVRLWEAFGSWKQDYTWIKSGVYKMPWDMVTPNKQYNPLNMAASTLRFMSEGAATLKRRVRAEAEPVWLQSKMYPQYYTKTFHYQSDGWLSGWSAANYEHSTETLFMGRQDAMQRTSLPAISEYISQSTKPVSKMKLLEVAAGTGRFHTFIKDNWPYLPSICSDLSPFYLQKARDNMKEWKRNRQANTSLGGTDGTGVTFMQMAAESLDLADASVDIVVCVYLFHEMPEAVRRKAVAEWFRVLKPGGLCVFTDSCQLGDRPELDSVSVNFGNFNEPYYKNFFFCDFGEMFSEAGFMPSKKYLCSATKTLSFVKPDAAAN